MLHINKSGTQGVKTRVRTRLQSIPIISKDIQGNLTNTNLQHPTSSYSTYANQILLATKF